LRNIDDTKVPYLGDISILGHLFKNTSHEDNKDELMIFITPKIVHEGVNVYNCAPRGFRPS
jgi:type IV pilus assembly protein PilQ